MIVDQCTDSRKCEYTCGSGFVRAGNRCVPEAFCENLTVPSHIRPERDYPLVQCEGDSNANYFRYTITGPDINYTSPAFPMTAHKGEHVHAGFLPKSGTYEVNCFVGNVAESVHTDVSVPAACQKNIIADTNAPFCKRLDRYIVGESEPNFSDSLLEGENIQYTCTAQPGSPNL